MKNNHVKFLATAGLITMLVGCGVSADYSSFPTLASAQTNEETTITQEQAKEYALAAAGVHEEEVSALDVHLDEENGKVHYDVEFNVDGYHYDYEIDKTTAAIIHQEKEPLNSDQNEAKMDQSAKETANDAQTAKELVSNSSNEITKEEAKQIALQDAGMSASEVKFVKAKEDYEDGQTVYEIEFYGNQTEYDYEIAKKGGTILEKDYEIENWSYDQNTSTSSISLDEAKAIALAKVNGATNSNIQIEKDVDDGFLIYEGEIYYQGVEYEFEINGSNGMIVEWSVD